jgi:beta-N-acetylhexosaminidase
MPPTLRHPRRTRHPRRSAAVVRRRFVAVLIVGAAVAVVAAWAFAPDPSPEPGSRPAASTAPEERDGDRQAPGLPLSRAVGRKIMTTMDGTFPSRSLRARVRRGEIGGVILFEPNVGPGLDAAIRSLQRNALAGGNPPLLIAVDQEGGLVKRFAARPPSRAPAQMDAGAAGSEGAATGAALRARGINTNLAPVADVNHGSFLGSRSFGADPHQVALAACAFATGLQSAGVNATLKHFPGLGRTMSNTDLHVVSVPASAAALRSDLAPYRRCGAQTRLVMLSNATYPALDRRRPAVLSRRIVTGLLRGELGYGGVTITDTLAAPGVRFETAGVRASRAGVDILLYVGEQTSARGYRTLLRAARTGQLSRAAVLASAARIDALAR